MVPCGSAVPLHLEPAVGAREVLVAGDGVGSSPGPRLALAGPPQQPLSGPAVGVIGQVDAALGGHCDHRSPQFGLPVELRRQTLERPPTDPGLQQFDGTRALRVHATA